jgi:hypothetical protein
MSRNFFCECPCKLNKSDVSLIILKNYMIYVPSLIMRQSTDPFHLSNRSSNRTVLKGIVSRDSVSTETIGV